MDCSLISFDDGQSNYYILRMNAILGNLLAFSFTAGEMMMVAVAFSLRTEDELQHALYWPFFHFRFLYFLSWNQQDSQGRIEEAKDQIAKMAKINGKVSPFKDTDSGEISLDMVDNGNYSANSKKHQSGEGCGED